ncbi:MAG: GNAT family N-acetyltransferase [Pleurocapsa sp. SU_5_0]|nr:GNAT family N-acetyltransferase [Pleurocapsa sp. SU_5_0]NJR45792.1 GNAT family N-acetyltransferase [Hyellaceae cyanobacterium CSU_1_1]
MVFKSLDSDVEHDLKLTIHPAVIEDTKEISAILAQSFYNFPEFAHWVYPFLRFTINEDLRYRLRSTSPHYRCLVAKMTSANYNQDAQSNSDSESLIVGTIEVALRSALWSTSPQYPYISNLAVAQNYRRLGIASQLLTACEQAALDWGYQETQLHVLDRNESAKQLYCQNGYQISQIELNWGNLWFDYSPRLLLKKILPTC